MTAHAPEKILIVEDEPDIALALRLALEGAGYEPSWAGSGETALEMLQSLGDCHLMLLDIRMPGIDGVEVLKRLKSSDSDVTVIMMSGHGSEELAVECIKIGAEDYLSKPFVLDDMLQRVERAKSHRLAVIEKRRLEQEREDFFMMLSHDMKNPMTAVIGSIDIMREGRLGPVNEEQIEYLQSAIDSCNEVVMMIDNLLDIRRFEVGKMQLNIQSYNPLDIIRKVVSQFSRAAERDGIRLSLDCRDDIPDIAADRNALTRILGNLIGNALKFTPEDGQITVSCNCIRQLDTSLSRIPAHVQPPQDFQKQHCFVMLCVRDTGSGIPPNDLKYIFDRYTQSSNNNGRERGGAGLGLSFCKLAVESFGGIIWAESETGKGSEFIIMLPCVTR